MRLTVYTDYALRMLMYLALKDDGLATIEEIAQSYGISKNHLMKVAHQLGVAGYVDTVRGRNGGLRLAKPAKAIGLGEVVRHTEPDMAIVMCFEPTTPIARSCPIACYARPWSEPEPPLSRRLTIIALSDLVKPRASLQAMLSIAPVKATRASTAKPKRERPAKQ